MRAAIRYSEYKNAGKLPHNEVFDCSTCMDTSHQERRNCCGDFGTKYRYQIGTTEYSICPVSVYAFDPNVTQVIDIVLTSLESGIPVTPGGLLDQTKAFFDFKRIINDEQRLCHNELDKIRRDEEKREEANRKRNSGGSAPRRRR